MPKALSEQDAEAFRERICQAAARLFVEEGPAAVSMRRIAAELGCGTMTPYRYFASKEQIVTAVRTRGMHRFSEALERALDTPGDGRTRSRAVRDAYIAFARRETATYRLMFEYPEPRRDDPAYRQAHARMWRTVAAHVEVLVAEGVVEADAPLLGHQIWAALHGAVMLEIAGLLPEGFDAASLHTRTAGTLFEAARPRGGQA
ncbi:TetR/AcrR family transcriptional regulator [Frateuria terrea]|uniref:Transcriptional regulator, TetR family n=1 Tax=Frateuria terrea TaxID=529704 RepID=A0A1H6R4Q6_9GAMM|nr:TetR/AcrR family transcriptional regulator [Frateuria terrea]SEI50858.1 transcriptional regulator, TetR family [Frateuria terrea]SFP15826.1 transcriptional regulator, TetR family [Frateuria terrea]